MSTSPTNADQLQRFTFENTPARGQIITLSESYREITHRAEYPAAVSRLLGEFAAATTLFAALLKQDAVITVQARGTGPITTLMAECNQDNHLRGIAQGQFDALSEIPEEQQSLQTLLGDATLAITITPAKGQRYQGIVALDQPDLSACLEQYFTQSEQLDTKLKLCADQQQTAGIMIQQLPGERDEKEKATWEELCQLLATLTPEEQLSLSHNDQLYRLFHQHNVRLLQADQVTFGCSCSRQRTEQALLSLGAEELVKIAKEQPLTEINCQFCNQQYQFTSSDLLALLEDGSATLH